MYIKVFILAVIITTATAFECDKGNTVCDTTLTISHALTMNHPTQKAVYPFRGQLYKHNVKNTSSATPIPPHEVIIGDGYESPRLVVVANKQLPGPDIIVYEGQRLRVQVINSLQSDSVTIHWHGIEQKTTPWMDGVPFITQCPILPGQSFVYDFVAQPKGTFWYHSHIGSQRTKGLFGALIIRERNNEMQEHIIQINGWNHDWDSDVDHIKQFHGIYENRIQWLPTSSVDQEHFPHYKIHSILLNGRGRYYDPISREYNDPPLSLFNVTIGNRYRFRVINTGTAYPYIVSVDEHRIEVVASDGYNLRPESTDAFVINPGERYDFILTANQTEANYWIRVQTLEVERTHFSEAILHYAGATLEEPNTNKTMCSSTRRCKLLNCPFPANVYPPEYFTDCVGFEFFESDTDVDPVPQTTPNLMKEYFLNFAFTGRGFLATINGVSFKLPPVNALSQPQNIKTLCKETECNRETRCRCTHSLTIENGGVVQFVFSSLGLGTGGTHPIHVHGHSFHVLKIGYPGKDNATNQWTVQNPDIQCFGIFCNNATWKNSSWLGGNIPGLQVRNAPRKDTVVVPSRGYVVVRMEANNPGVWLLHCHTELHSTDGMAMVLNISYNSHPKPPSDLPRCHSFPQSYADEQVMSTTTTTYTTTTTCTTNTPYYGDDHVRLVYVWIMIGVFLLILLIMASMNCYFFNKLQKSKQYQL